MIEYSFEAAHILNTITIAEFAIVWYNKIANNRRTEDFNEISIYCHFVGVGFIGLCEK